MGCFGDMTPTKQVDTSQTQTVSPPDWVKLSGQQNYNTAQGVLNQGFQPYTGELTAPLSGNEKAAGNLISSTAATGNPFAATSAADFTNYGGTPGFKYNFNAVTDPNSPLGPMQNYMDPYIAAVLAPTLQQLSLTNSQNQQRVNSGATSAGAFGDSRHGVAQSLQDRDYLTQVANSTGGAFSGAFNSAMGLREQDLQRLFGTQQAQQSADETALGRMRQSGIDLTGLDQSGVSRALGLASALGTTGANERNVQQGADTANLNEFMRKNNFTDSQIAFLTSVLAGTPTEKTTVGTGQQTTSQPDNSGYQALGGIASSILGAI